MTDLIKYFKDHFHLGIELLKSTYSMSKMSVIDEDEQNNNGYLNMYFVEFLEFIG